MSGSGNSSNDGPTKTAGQYHSVKGTVVEGIGKMANSESWQKSGKEEHAAGEAEYNAAQAEGYVQGTSDRIGGYKDSVVGSITGDKQQQAAGNVRKEKGEAQQQLNKPSSS